MKTIITLDTIFFWVKVILRFHMSFFWLVPFGDQFYMTHIYGNMKIIT